LSSEYRNRKLSKMISTPATVPLNPRQNASPSASRRTDRPVNHFVVIGCGLALLLGAFAMQWLESAASNAEVSAAVAAAAQARAAAARAKPAQPTYAEREAQQRADQERIAAEEAAEKSKRASLLADAEVEARARAEREEMARKRAAVDLAQRAATESEEAWKRFYKPSAACKESSSATVECVNEYVKAKREFEVRRAAEGVR